MTDACLADVQSGESGCESAPLSPPSNAELSLIAAVHSLLYEMRVMNHALLEIVNTNSKLLQMLAESEPDDDDDQQGKPRYLGEPG